MLNIIQSLPTPSSGLFDSIKEFFSSLGVAEGILIVLVLAGIGVFVVWWINNLKIKRDGFRDDFIKISREIEEIKVRHRNEIIMYKDEHRKELLEEKQKYVSDVKEIIESSKNSTEDIVSKVGELIDKTTREYIDFAKEIIDEKDAKIIELELINQQLKETLKKYEND